MGWIEVPSLAKQEQDKKREFILERRRKRKESRNKQRSDERLFFQEIIKNNDVTKEFLSSLTRKQRRRLRCLLKNKKQKITYDVYIKSKQWLERRQKYWIQFGKECKACGSLERPVVHHMHYGSLGKEKNEHIIGLCWNCHEQLHDEYKTKRDMIKETIEFVECKFFEHLVKTL